jgi:hypothetical protein
MATEFLPSVGFTLTIPNITSLVRADDLEFGANAQAPPDNCVAIVVFNMSTADRVLVKFGQVGIVNSETMTITNSTVLPVSSSMTFSLGALGQRIHLYTGGQANLYFMAETTAANVLVNVTYLQGT